jgi:shikimate dehydrogenase
VLGAGGTARAALAAAAALACPQVTLIARRPEAAAELGGVAAALGVPMIAVSWPDAPAALDNDVVVSTVPKGVADQFAAAVRWRPGGVVFDALYDPWPTPLADAAATAGARVVSGLDLLLAQALSQFEQFTGVRPAAAMRNALRAAATRG